MQYTNKTFTGSYQQIRDYIGASIPQHHPENWPDGPWELVEYVVPEPTAEQIKSDFNAKIQSKLDDFAMTRGYAGILSACTYATSSIPKFAQEGQFCVNLRDQAWQAAYQIMQDCESGLRSIPESIDDIIDELPAFEWPENITDEI